MAYINGYVAAGTLPAQSLLVDHPVYIYGGLADPVVYPVTTREQARYFES